MAQPVPRRQVDDVDDSLVGWRQHALRRVGAHASRFRPRGRGPNSTGSAPAITLVIMLAAIAAAAPSSPSAADRSPVTASAISELGPFRDAVVSIVRAAANQSLTGGAEHPAEVRHWDGHWQLSVSVFYGGRKIGVGAAAGGYLDEALSKAVGRAIRRRGRAVLEPNSLPGARFLVSFEYPPGRRLSIIEHDGKGMELVGEIVALRRLTTKRVRAQVEAAKSYLLRAKHPRLHGFPKKYDALEDRFEQQLRTIYTASSLYSLLRTNDLSRDEDVEASVRPIADFILFMQQSAGDNAGAFHYAYHPGSQEKEKRFPVGTTAKTIFTLLELYLRVDDDKYLDAAVQAGNWLLGMQRPDGTLPSEADTGSGTATTPGRFSLFYNSQVLSALSRLYQVTQAQRYLTGATSIAHRLMQTIEEEGALLVDEVRGKVGTITTSWVAMALLDYARAAEDDSNLGVVFRSADAMLARQARDETDIYNHGRFSDTSATSGNAWINEVMVEIYRRCIILSRPDCDRYRDSVVLASRWLIQNTYAEANSFHIPRPENAMGGLMRNPREESVRTDAVCHAANGLIGLLEIADRELLLSVPEPSLEATLNQLRLGRGKYHGIHSRQGAGPGR